MEAYLLLISLAAEMREIGNANLARHGLGEGRCSVLLLLLENQPEPLSHSRLAELLGVTKGSITGLVDGLEHDGLRQARRPRRRSPDAADLDHAGRLELVGQALPEKFNGITGLMAGLSPAEAGDPGRDSCSRSRRAFPPTGAPDAPR